MDNYAANRINTKKTIGVSIHKNMSIETLTEKLKDSNSDFTSEISALESVSILKQNNFDLFQNIQSLTEQLNSANSTIADGMNNYVKENTEAINKMDKFAHAGGSAIFSNAGLPLIPISNNLTTVKTTLNNLTEQISNKTNQLLSNADNILNQSNSLKDQIFDKIISLSKQL